MTTCWCFSYTLWSVAILRFGGLSANSPPSRALLACSWHQSFSASVALQNKRQVGVFGSVFWAHWSFALRSDYHDSWLHLRSRWKDQVLILFGGSMEFLLLQHSATSWDLSVSRILNINFIMPILIFIKSILHHICIHMLSKFAL